MTKFITLNKSPKKIQKGEMVITFPDFQEEIKSVMHLCPKNKMMSVNFLRSIISAIGRKYVGDNFNEMTAIKYSLYAGLPCEDIVDISTAVLEAIRKEAPYILDAYTDFLIKNRPLNIRLIYFIGDSKATMPFYKNGIDLIPARKIEEYMGREKKKN